MLNASVHALDANYYSQASISWNSSLEHYGGYIVDASNVYGAISCNPIYSSLHYEVRVAGCFEADQAHSGWGVHNGGPIYVNLRKCNSNIDNTMPTVLILNSFENTWWTVDSDDDDIINNINLYEIAAYSYYIENTSVVLGPNLLNAGVTTTNGISVNKDYYGYGSDNSPTDELVTFINNKYNVEPYSMIGVYEYETIYLCVGQQYQSNTCSPTTDPTTNPTLYPTSNTLNPTNDPTTNPTFNPSTDPTTDPTKDPTINPTVYPTIYPSIHPTTDPTHNPTKGPIEGQIIETTENKGLEPTNPTPRENSDSSMSLIIIYNALMVIIGCLCI